LALNNNPSLRYTGTPLIIGLLCPHGMVAVSGYYVKTRADNSGYANHRVICLVVIGSSFDSEQVFQVSNGYL
jgi:hypothetical protein